MRTFLLFVAAMFINQAVIASESFNLTIKEYKKANPIDRESIEGVFTGQCFIPTQEKGISNALRIQKQVDEFFTNFITHYGNNSNYYENEFIAAEIEYLIDAKLKFSQKHKLELLYDGELSLLTVYRHSLSEETARRLKREHNLAFLRQDGEDLNTLYVKSAPRTGNNYVCKLTRKNKKITSR